MGINSQQKIKNFLDKSIEKNVIFGAYLFSGPEGVGKFDLALEFAEKITNSQAGGQKINPDIIIIAPEEEEKKGVVKKKDIKVEKIRELEHQLSLSSHGGQYKVAIINEADRLTVSAQNALLKTLEEPREKAVIILIAHNQEKILVTLRSRCVIKKFNPFEKEADAALTVEFRKILKMSLTEKFVLAENLSKNVPEILTLLDSWTVILRENIFKKEKNIQLDLGINSAQALEAIEEIGKTTLSLKETNANARCLLESLFLKF